MTLRHKVSVWFTVFIVIAGLCAGIARYARQCNVPPPNIATSRDLIKWIGRPMWVMKYSGTNVTFYEIGRQQSVLVLALTFASGPPSYTVDQEGRFIGWSPDSGEICSPIEIRSKNLKRERVDVDAFLVRAFEVALKEQTSPPPPTNPPADGKR